MEKARTEAEEAQRILLAALNGLAGLMILDGDRQQAVALYRQAWGSDTCTDCGSVPPSSGNSSCIARDGIYLAGALVTAMHP